MKERNRNLLLLHVTVIIFGLTGIFGRLLEENLDSFNIVLYRVLIGGAGIGAYALYKRKDFKVKNLRELLTLVGVGLIICAHWIFFFEAINVSNVSIALATISSTSLFLAFLKPFITGEKVVSYEIWLGLVVIVGIVIIMGYEFDYWLGIVYSLIAAFLAAVFALINSNLVQKHDSTKISFYEISSAALILLAVMSVYGAVKPMSQISTTDWLWLSLLGLLATSFAFIASVAVMKVLSAFTVSLTINLEPIYSIIIALIVFTETESMSAQFYYGAVLIVSTLFVNAYLKKRDRNKMAPSK